MNATAQTTALHTGHGVPPTIVARQVKQHHCGYTPAVLRAVAHRQPRRPTTQVQRMLRDCLTPLGVRLTAATLHELAVNSRQCPMRDARAGLEIRPMSITSPSSTYFRVSTVGRPVEVPRASAVQLVRMSGYDTGWVGVDRAHCCCRTDGCGQVFDDAHLWDAHRPARVCMWTPARGWCKPKTGSGWGHWTDCAANPAARAGQTGKGGLCFGVGVRRSAEVSGPNGDRQGRGRSPPAPVCPRSPVDGERGQTGGGYAARNLWIWGRAHRDGAWMPDWLLCKCVALRSHAEDVSV